MRQNRRRTGSRRSADDKIKYMRMAAIPLVIVLVLVAIILVMDRKPSNKEASASTDISLSTDEDINISGDSSASPEDGGVEPDNNQYTTDFSQYELKKDEIPQVNQLSIFRQRWTRTPRRCTGYSGKAMIPGWMRVRKN